MSTTCADALVSEMAQKFNDALDGVDPINLNDDKTLKWRGLLNNKFASSSCRRNKKHSDSDPTTISSAASPVHVSRGDIVASTTATSLSAGGGSGGDKVNNEPTVNDKEHEAVEDDAFNVSDKPKRVLRRKAKQQTEIVGHAVEKKTTRASKSMTKDDEPDSDTDPAIVPNKRRSRAAKRNSSSQDCAGQSNFEPKTMRTTRRSDRQMQQQIVEQIHGLDGVEDSIKIEEADAAMRSFDSTLLETKSKLNTVDGIHELPKTEPHEQYDTANDCVQVVELKPPETITVDEDDDNEVQEGKINGEVKPDGDGKIDVAPPMIEVKKQRISTEEDDTKNVNSFVETVMEDEQQQERCKSEDVDVVEVKDEQMPIPSAVTIVPPVVPVPVPSIVLVKQNCIQSPQPSVEPSELGIAMGASTFQTEIKIPKKRGRKPGYKKLLNPVTAAIKKSARISREQDSDPAFDPITSKIINPSTDAASNAPTRLSRRIKPTAKILANDELRYGFELQNNARLSLSSEHLDAEQRSPVKDEQNLQFTVTTSVPCSKEASPVAVSDADDLRPPPAKVKTKPTFMVVIPSRRRAPCPDPVEFLNTIKQEKINLNRSPEDNKKMSQKQRKRLMKLKEKHFNKLGLQRTRVNPSSSHESSEVDEAEEEFVPNKKITVEKRNVTLRLRANTITLDKPHSLEPIRSDSKRRKSKNQDNQQPSAKKRSYTVIKSNHHETSLILSTKHKPNTDRNIARPPASQSPIVVNNKPTETIDPTNCLCVKPSKYYTKRTAETMYCRAMDEIAGNLIGCCNEVPDANLINLLRQSVRVKYSIFCEAHVTRLHAHHSCAGCGVFCTQGRFIMCKRNHLFHRDCATKFILNTPFSSEVEFVCPTLVLRCPHCGMEAPEKETQITMKCRTNPVFSPYQARPTKVAKMSIGKHTFTSSVAVQRSGPRQFQWELEKLIPAHIMDVILQSPSSGNANSVEYTQKDVIQAMQTDNVNRMAEIIASGYDINAPLTDFARGTCLHLVASYGSIAMAYLLLSRAPSVDYINRVDRELKSALMCSVFNVKNDILRLLVQCGADVTLRGYGGMTALHMAAKANNFEATQIILESYRRSTSSHRFDMFVNAVDDGGWTTIVWAAELGYSDIVTYLVQCGANLSICDAEKNTVLHWAALSDDVATVRPLLAEADLNVQNMNGDTPLHIACRNSNTRMCLMFLAHGACLELQNDQAEKPFDGISDVNSVCAKAVKFNQKLRQLARFGEHEIVCQDISKGREAYPIKVIKRRQQRSATSPITDDDLIDDDNIPHFIYITQSIILQSNIQIDRRISKMRICACVDNCTSSCCQCSEISVQNWYNSEGRLNGDFNFADPAMIFECNDVCGCNKMRCMNRVVQNGQKVALQVVECGGAKGWGVTTIGDIARGTFVAEYTGEILTDVEAERRTDDSYFFDLDASDHCIDAHYYGNVSRFFNHSCAPNVVPIRVYYEHQDLRFPKIAFFAARDIVANEEITFDYGDKFWTTKYKTFSCECRSTECRFPGENPNPPESLIQKQPPQRTTSANIADASSML